MVTKQKIPGINRKCGIGNYGLSDEEIYHIYMLHEYQHIRSDKIARQFGLTTAQVQKIIARRVNSSCCG